MSNPLDGDFLAIDAEAEVGRIIDGLRRALRATRRRGLVVGISGGVDSGVCAALCVEAVGPKKVFGLLMPEHDSSGSSVELGRSVVEKLGIDHAVEHLGPALEAIGCYRQRDEAIRRVFPDYDGTWKNKIVIRGGLEGGINHFHLVVETPTGEIRERRLPLPEYLQIVAATNYKQRLRKAIEYFHADRLNYAVIGTPNRLEYDQGFFVKNGDGSADIKPIAHLYKTQVYQLARHLDLPEAVATATPTTDTYSMEQGQDEFYFALPWDRMDIALWALNHDVPAEQLAERLGISVEQAEHVYDDIRAKRRTTRYQHALPILLAPVPEIDHTLKI